ncbi:hypothetical protein IAT38_000311 [Cryptococcus sp. DSM 104549]
MADQQHYQQQQASYYTNPSTTASSTAQTATYGGPTTSSNNQQPHQFTGNTTGFSASGQPPQSYLASNQSTSAPFMPYGRQSGHGGTQGAANHWEAAATAGRKKNADGDMKTAVGANDKYQSEFDRQQEQGWMPPKTASGEQVAEEEAGAWGGW